MSTNGNGGRTSFTNRLEQNLGVDDGATAEASADTEADAGGDGATQSGEAAAFDPTEQRRGAPGSLETPPPPGMDVEGGIEGDQPGGGQTGPRERPGGGGGPPPDPAPSGDPNAGGPPESFGPGDVTRQGPGESPRPDRPATARPPRDVEPGEIARDVGGAIERGELQPPEREPRGATEFTRQERTAIAEARVRSGRTQSGFNQPVDVRNVGQGAFIVTLGEGTDAERVPVAFDQAAAGRLAGFLESEIRTAPEPEVERRRSNLPTGMRDLGVQLDVDERRQRRQTRRERFQGVFGPTLDPGERQELAEAGVDVERGQTPRLGPSLGAPGPFLPGSRPRGQVTEAPSAEQLREGGLGPAEIAGGIFGTAAEGVLGPPGVLESELGFAVQNPREAIFGPPGSIESGAGDVAFGIRDVSRGAVDVATEEVVEPGAGVVGEVFESTPIFAPVPGEGAITQTPEELAGEEDGRLIDTQPETAAGRVGETFALGAGVGAAETTLGLPAGAVEAGALGAEAGEFTAAQIEEQGFVEGGETAAVAGATFGAAAAVDVAEAAAENPVQTSGLLAGGLVTGVGTARAFERAVIRGRIAARTSGDRVDLGDTTTERGQAGELPEFETSPGAPTSQAVREVRQRAADQPETLQADIGESVLFRSEAERLPGDFEAGRGQFELPGLFASPDASPLRLDIGAEGSTSLRPRLPRLFAQPQRLSAFESPDIEGMPESATGARIISDPDTGEPMPDPTTSGAQFLEGPAERGTAFVRPTGSRSTELEAIFPPGTEFVREGARAVDIEGGDPGTLDIFRRVETEGEADAPDAERLTGQEIIRREREAGAPEGPPVTPAVPGAPAASGGGATVPGTRAGESPTTARPSASPFGEVADSVAGNVPGRSATDTDRETSTATEPAPTQPSVPTGSTTGAAGAPSSPFGFGTTGVSGPVSGGPSGLPSSVPGAPGEPTPSGPPGTPSDPPTSPLGTPPPPTSISQRPPPPPDIPGTPPPPPSDIPGRPPPPPTGIPQTPPPPPDIPGTPPPPPSRIRVGEDDPDDREEEFVPIGPQGTQFVNRIPTGAQLLGLGSGGSPFEGGAGGADGQGNINNPFQGTASAGGGDGDDNLDPTGLFLG